jgi:Reverse transcriptase (RNA-dependent DNA polymerase)
MPLSVIATLNAMALKDGRTSKNCSTKQVTQTGSQPSFITPCDVAVERKGDSSIASSTPSEGLISTTSWPQIDDTHSRLTASEAPSTHAENDTDIRKQPEGDIGVQPATESTEMLNTAVRTDAEIEMNYPNQPSVPDRRTILDFIRNGEQALVVSATTEVTDMLRARKESGVIVDAGNISVKTAILTRGAEATRVITAELKQMLEKGVWEPVKGYTLSSEERRRIIRSSMFIHSKYNPDGTFNKLKARLIAGGDQQDKSIYDDLSSPTVATSSVFTVMAIAAHEGRKTAVVDVGGAFLNARMVGTIPVHMRLDKTMTDFVIGLDKRYRRYTDAGGRVTVLLKRALYGCVESAGLWHANLCVTVGELGYIKNEVDGCVFNRVDHDGVQCTACVHVDDLFITSKSDQMISELCEGLRKVWRDFTSTGAADQLLGYDGRYDRDWGS